MQKKSKITNKVSLFASQILYYILSAICLIVGAVLILPLQLISSLMELWFEKTK